jgi:16S rRNA (guanine527-N7)-methyltransferase
MELIQKYFPELSEKQFAQFENLRFLYEDWNSKINVISRNDIEFFYERHVLHSLAIAKFIRFKRGTKILDIGTGGGFPGIPLAIYFPESEFTLVDSIGKKIKVVNEVAKSLGLKNVKAINVRAENMKSQFDFIVSRAVTSMNNFVHLTKNKIKQKQQNAIPNGILYLKGGDLTEEFSQIKNYFEITEISQYFNESFFETKKLVYLHIN